MIIEKTFYAVQCDKCNQICKTAMEYDFWDSIGEAVQFAEDQEWYCTEDGKHYCDKCYKLDGSGKPIFNF